MVSDKLWCPAAPKCSAHQSTGQRKQPAQRYASYLHPLPKPTSRLRSSVGSRLRGKSAAISKNISRAIIVTSKLFTIFVGIDLCFGAQMKRTFRPLFTAATWSGKPALDSTLVTQRDGNGKQPTIVTTSVIAIGTMVRYIVHLANYCPTNSQEMAQLGLSLSNFVCSMTEKVIDTTVTASLKSIDSYRLGYSSFSDNHSNRKYNGNSIQFYNSSSTLRSKLATHGFPSFITSPVLSNVYYRGGLHSYSTTSLYGRSLFLVNIKSSLHVSANTSLSCQSLHQPKAPLNQKMTRLDDTMTDPLSMVADISDCLRWGNVDTAIETISGRLCKLSGTSDAVPFVKLLLESFSDLNEGTVERFFHLLILRWLQILDHRAAYQQVDIAVGRAFDRKNRFEFCKRCLLKTAAYQPNNTPLDFTNIIIDLLKKSLDTTPSDILAAQCYSEMLIRVKPDHTFPDTLCTLIRLCSRLKTCTTGRQHDALRMLLEPVLYHVCINGERDYIVQILKLVAPPDYRISIRMLEGIVAGLKRSRLPHLLNGIFGIMADANCLYHPAIVTTLLRALLNQQQYALADTLYKMTDSMLLDDGDRVSIKRVMSSYFVAQKDLTQLIGSIDELIEKGRPFSCSSLMIRQVDILCKRLSPSDALDELMKYKALGVPITVAALTKVMNSFFCRHEYYKAIDVLHMFPALRLSPDIATCTVICKVLGANRNIKGLNKLVSYMDQSGIQRDTLFYQELLHFHQRLKPCPESLLVVREVIDLNIPLYKAATRALLQWLINNKMLDLALKVWEGGVVRRVYFNESLIMSLARLCLDCGAKDQQRCIIVEFKESTLRKERAERIYHTN
ncbi:hypothetical protein BASA62_001217 [Batrachochytrium salamandrivorans]|nr:hypothetical protein BASA62_001217 [Batrachochytrium salamandrivorans]